MLPPPPCYLCVLISEIHVLRSHTHLAGSDPLSSGVVKADGQTRASRGAKGSIDLKCYEELDGPSQKSLVRIKTLTRAPTKPADSPSPVDSTDMAAFFNPFESADFLQPPARAHATQPETPAGGRRANAAPLVSSYDQRMASVMSSVATGAKVKDAATLPPSNLLESPTWPRDWSLKTSVKFVSLTPFHILPSNPSARVSPPSPPRVFMHALPNLPVRQEAGNDVCAGRLTVAPPVRPSTCSRCSQRSRARSVLRRTRATERSSTTATQPLLSQQPSLR